MIAIGIQKPDIGNILAVRPDVPLITGLGPVLNIILAYSEHSPDLPFRIAQYLTSNSRPRRLLLLPRRTQEPARLHQGPPSRTIPRRALLHDHLSSHILLRRPPRCQSCTWLCKPSRYQDRLWHRPPDYHRSRRRERICGHQVYVLQALVRLGHSVQEESQEP